MIGACVEAWHRGARTCSRGHGADPPRASLSRSGPVVVIQGSPAAAGGLLHPVRDHPEREGVWEGKRVETPMARARGAGSKSPEAKRAEAGGKRGEAVWTRSLYIVAVLKQVHSNTGNGRWRHAHAERCGRERGVMSRARRSIARGWTGRARVP